MVNSQLNTEFDLDGKSILITGGTGSFGTRLFHKLLDEHNPKRVILLARGEYNHFKIQNSLTAEQLHKVRFFIGDVRDFDRLIMAFQGVDIVFHAAAQKQVPLAEYNPFECVRTNIEGAENVVQAAIRTNVKHVIALSTDKAVNPINLYGATKLASDKIFVAANSLGASSGTLFSVVRYGNVLGSKGSVIPFFRRLIREGVQELPITDDRMTRFWITLDQAADFVVSCLPLMRGGEIFVPKIPSMNIVDLAKALAPDLPIKHIGIRPGEKIHELMITDHNSSTTVEMEDRYIIEPEWQYWPRRSFIDDGFQLVQPGFEYTSDKNDKWLNHHQLAETLKDIPYLMD